MIPGDDRYFLMYFIMGTYFGPDLKGERTQKSALQRLAEGLPPYTSEQLFGSHIRASEIEQIYYFLTRKAEKSLVVKLPMLHQFIEGSYPCQGEEATGIYPQFPALFPPHLHPQTESLNHSRIIGNVVFIRNPAIFYVKKEDVERFKRLTGLEDLFVESSTSQLPNCPVQREELDEEDGEDVPIAKFYRVCQRKRRLNEILGSGKPRPQEVQQCNGAPKSYELTLHPSVRQLRTEVSDGPGMVILPSRPKREVLDRMVGVAQNAYGLTGSAALGQVGPVVGLMDIGESEDSYLFRVALPGVKRENRAFQCEVESDGKVLIKGETVTGEKRVFRFSQAFVMQTQNLCPSGPFTVMFQLPGPVDPQEFSGSFGTDGILEGVVMKQKPSRLT